MNHYAEKFIPNYSNYHSFIFIETFQNNIIVVPITLKLQPGTGATRDFSDIKHVPLNISSNFPFVIETSLVILKVGENDYFLAIIVRPYSNKLDKPI